MPPDLRYLGNQYLSAEFRKHQNAPKEYLPGFFTAWEDYRELLEQQLNSRLEGRKLDTEIVDKLSADKLGQLYELHQSSKQINNPRTE
jgi:hypothetical protein